MTDIEHHAITCLRVLSEEDFSFVVATLHERANYLEGQDGENKRRIKDLRDAADALGATRHSR